MFVPLALEYRFKTRRLEAHVESTHAGKKTENFHKPNISPRQVAGQAPSLFTHHAKYLEVYLLTYLAHVYSHVAQDTKELRVSPWVKFDKLFRVRTRDCFLGIFV